MEEVKYGLVKIIKGEYKGRFGLYDDDDFDVSELDEELDDEELEVHPLVYLGDMLLNAPYVILNKDEITNKISQEDIDNRISEIIKSLFLTSNTKKRLALYEELVLLQNNYEVIDDE